MDWNNVFSGLQKAGVIGESFVSEVSETQKREIVILCQNCQRFFTYCSNGSVRLEELKSDIKLIVYDSSFKFLHIKLKVDLLKIQIQILDKLTLFDDAKLAIDRAVKVVDESPRTLKNTTKLPETVKLIEQAGDTLHALTLAPYQLGMVKLLIQSGTQANVAPDNAVEDRGQLDMAFMIPKAELLILKGDILRKEARNNGDEKYLEAISVYESLLREMDAFSYYPSVSDGNASMFNYLYCEAKENSVWAQRLLSTTGRVKEKTDLVVRAAEELVKYTEGKLNENDPLSCFAYGKACFLLGDLCFEGSEKDQWQAKEIIACQKAYTKLSQPDVLVGNHHLRLKISLQYAMALMKPGQTNDTRQALQILNEQIEKAPFERRLYSAKAKAHVELKEYKEALATCERCLANGSGDTPMKLLMGKSLIKLLENEPDNFVNPTKLKNVLCELASATKDTSLDVKPTIRLVFEAALLLLKASLPSTDSVTVEQELRNLFQLLQHDDKTAVCQSLELLNKCDSKLLSNFLLMHFFPVQGEFSCLDLAYILHQFAMRYNAFEDRQAGFMVKELFGKIQEAVKSVESVAYLNNVSFTTYMHLFVSGVKGVPDFSNYKHNEQSTFIKTCRKMAPLNDPSEEEIYRSFTGSAADRKTIEHRMGIFNYRRFCDLLDGGSFLYPVEEFSKHFSDPNSYKIKEWSKELQIIFQGGFLYGDYPKPEELYAALYWLNQSYMKAEGTAKPLLEHMDRIYRKLESEGLVKDASESLTAYAKERVEYVEKEVEGKNPYAQDGSPYKEKPTAPSVDQAVQVTTTTAYLKPSYSGKSRC